MKRLILAAATALLLAAAAPATAGWEYVPSLGKYVWMETCPQHGQNMLDSLQRYHQRHRQQERDAMHDIADRLDKIRREATINRFINQGDFSREGVLRFSRNNNLDAQEFQAIVDIARSMGGLR